MMTFLEAFLTIFRIITELKTLGVFFTSCCNLSLEPGDEWGKGYGNLLQDLI